MASTGFKYEEGTHWTQRPENRARLSRMVKRMHREKKRARKMSKIERAVAKRVHATKRSKRVPQHVITKRALDAYDAELQNARLNPVNGRGQESTIIIGGLRVTGLNLKIEQT